MKRAVMLLALLLACSVSVPLYAFTPYVPSYQPEVRDLLDIILGNEDPVDEMVSYIREHRVDIDSLNTGDADSTFFILLVERYLSPDFLERSDLGSRAYYAVLSIDVFKALIDLGADVNYALPSQPLPIVTAWKRREVAPDLFELLLQEGADVNRRDADGRTLLMHHFMDEETNNSYEDFERLLKLKARVNIRDDSDCTALTRAILNGVDNPHIYETLFDHKADVNLPDEDGITPFMRAGMMITNTQILQMFLDQGADPFAIVPEEGVSMLMIAAATNENPAVTRMFFELGVDASLRDSSGLTAFEHAEQNPALQQSEIYWDLEQYQYDPQPEAVKAQRSGSWFFRSLTGIILLLLLLYLYQYIMWKRKKCIIESPRLARINRQLDGLISDDLLDTIKGRLQHILRERIEKHSDTEHSNDTNE